MNKENVDRDRLESFFINEIKRNSYEDLHKRMRSIIRSRLHTILCDRGFKNRTHIKTLNKDVEIYLELHTIGAEISVDDLLVKMRFVNLANLLDAGLLTNFEK